jgi:hypothetical protein
MNGASDELCATTMKAPSRNNVTTMGTIHHRFEPKNESSSPATRKFLAALRMNFIDQSP